MDIFDEFTYNESVINNPIDCKDNMESTLVFLYSIIAFTNCMLVYFKIKEQCQTDSCQRRRTDFKRTILKTIENCVLRMMMKNGNDSEDEHEE